MTPPAQSCPTPRPPPPPPSQGFMTSTRCSVTHSRRFMIKLISGTDPKAMYSMVCVCVHHTQWISISSKKVTRVSMMPVGAEIAPARGHPRVPRAPSTAEGNQTDNVTPGAHHEHGAKEATDVLLAGLLLPEEASDQQSHDDWQASAGGAGGRADALADGAWPASSHGRHIVRAQREPTAWGVACGGSQA